MRSSSTLAGVITKGWRLLSIRATAPSLCSVAVASRSEQQSFRATRNPHIDARLNSRSITIPLLSQPWLVSLIDQYSSTASGTLAIELIIVTTP